MYPLFWLQDVCRWVPGKDLLLWHMVSSIPLAMALVGLWQWLFLYRYIISMWFGKKGNSHRETCCSFASQYATSESCLGQKHLIGFSSHASMQLLLSNTQTLLCLRKGFHFHYQLENRLTVLGWGRTESEQKVYRVQGTLPYLIINIFCDWTQKHL